jgi:anthraniloyl-CoA monooxygenase
MHLADPYWTLHAAVEQGDSSTDWPAPYQGGRDLMLRLRERQEASIRV